VFIVSDVNYELEEVKEVKEEGGGYSVYDRR
jgi:hypothetical protein